MYANSPEDKSHSSDIRAAAKTIRSAVERTPTRIRARVGHGRFEIILKFENLQFTASYKERGALNKLSSLTPEQRARGVAAMSAGNHAQGVAYHAGRLGIPATIVMPEGTPFNKVKHTKDFGARVVIDGVTLSESFIRARAIADAEQLAFIHPYDDPLIIAGQGTVGLEMLEDAPEIDVLVVPVGGGGLISGVAIAAKALKPDIEIYGVEAQLYPSMYDAVKGASLPCGGQTIAEGIAVKQPGAITSAIIARHGEGHFARARGRDRASDRSLLEIEKTVVEGAGAAAMRWFPDIRKLHRSQCWHGVVGRRYGHAAPAECDPAGNVARGTHSVDGARDRGSSRDSSRRSPRWSAKPAATSSRSRTIA